jgi:hypothetical protein
MKRHSSATMAAYPGVKDILTYAKDHASATRNPDTGLTDFEAAFQRDNKRLPTVKELTAHKAAMAAAGRNPAPENDLDLVAESIAKGDLTRLKDITSLRGDQRLHLFAKVKKLNPNFNTADIDRQIKMEDAVTNGKDGQNLQSFGTFLEHAGEAHDVVQKFRTSPLPIINKPFNWLRKNMGGDESFQQFAAALEPVRKEFEGFLLGGRALYGDDRKAAETILSDTSSPAQIQAALKQMAHTAKARANEINYRYKRVRGKDLEDAFSPEAMEAAGKLGVNLEFGKAKTTEPTAPPKGAKVRDYTDLK